MHMTHAGGIRAPIMRHHVNYEQSAVGFERARHLMQRGLNIHNVVQHKHGDGQIHFAIFQRQGLQASAAKLHMLHMRKPFLRGVQH